MSSTRWGFAAGAVSARGRTRGADMLFCAVATTDLQRTMQLFYDLYFMPFTPGFGMNAGINVFRDVNDFQLYAGVGPGMHYIHAADNRHGRNTSLALRTHLGFSRQATNNLQLQAQIPFTFLFSREKVFQTGIEMRFLFSGRRNHIEVLNF